MIRVLLLLCGLALAGQDRAEIADRLLSEMRMLDQAELHGVLVERYERHVLDTAPLVRNGEALAIVARARFAMGDENRAQQLLYRALTSPDTEHFVALERVRLYMEADDLQRALQALTELRGGKRELRLPDQPLAYLLLARIHARLDEYELASPAAVRFLAMAPRHRQAATAWHILAQAAIKSHDADHARTCRARAEELERWNALLKARSVQVVRHPADPLPRLGIALLWMEAEDTLRAYDELLELTERFPDFCRGWFHLAEVERELGDEDAALEAYDRALACDPTHAPARMNRGMLHHEAGRAAEARADLELLVATESGNDPTYAAAHLVLARLHLAAGSKAEADASYARYRELGGTEPLEE